MSEEPGPLTGQHAASVPDADLRQVRTLSDLVRLIEALRRRAARRGQVRLSIRDLADRSGVAPSTLEPYLRGDRMCPADTFEKLLLALRVPPGHLRPWLDAWERVAEAGLRRPRRIPTERRVDRQRAGGRDRVRVVREQRTTQYRVVNAPVNARVAIVSGELRNVRSADIWINSENTDMQMARHNEYSVSAVIRFLGARRDETGRVIEDLVADELTRRVASRQVAAATAIRTAPGALAETNGVRHIIHVAAVHGDPTDGYRQVIDVGRCVSSALVEAERIAGADPLTTSILFPLLGAGVGGAAVEPTVQAMLDAAIGHLVGPDCRHIRTVLFLAHTEEELDVCMNMFDAHPGLGYSE